MEPLNYKGEHEQETPIKLSFVEKIKGFLIKPIETFNQVKSEEFGDAMKYYIVLFGIFAALCGPILAVLDRAFHLYGGFSASLGLLIIPFVFVSGIVGLFIGGAIVHLGVIIFGNKKGFTNTLKALIYGGTPIYLFGWVPIIGVIVSLWALVLAILGIKELQEISILRAVAAVLPIIIFSIVLVILTAIVLVILVPYIYF